MPLSQNSTAELQKISHHKLHSLGQSCISLLEVALKASQQADHERDSIIRLILDEKTDFTLISAELSRIAREQMIKTRDLITAHLHAKHRVALTRKIMADLSRQCLSGKGISGAILGSMSTG